MSIPGFLRAFDARRREDTDQDDVLLADFNQRPAQTINVTPSQPALGLESGHLAPSTELNTVMERLAAGMVEAWGAAVRDMQAILAADHAKLEAATSEVLRIPEQLQSLTQELTSMRHRIQALEESIDELRRKQPQLNERLDTQAAALRQLHQTARTRAHGLDELSRVLLKLSGPAGHSLTAGPLPERL